MLPSELKSEQFNGYPPQARKLCQAYLVALQKLPLTFVPSLLREVIEYDFRFPAERRALDRELENLASLSAAQQKEWFREFAAIQLSPKLEHLDWVNSPAQFTEQLSEFLWSTHQLDAFRIAATNYADHLRAVLPAEPPPIPRLVICIVGQGVDSYDRPLFRKLRPHGAYFSAVDPANGMNILMDAVAARAKTHPEPYSHWYLDGGREAEHNGSLATVSYATLAPAREALLRKMQSEIGRPGMGPEALRTLMAQMRPADIGLNQSADPVLAWFRLKLLTEGSGTQIFSTTFVQWAAREALRRAQPVSMLVRFAPRQRQKPMNELLSPNSRPPELDPIGSLIDADMGAYYSWINQQRLPGADKASFVAWFEDHNCAVVIGPAVPRGTTSSAPTDVAKLLSWIS